MEADYTIDYFIDKFEAWPMLNRPYHTFGEIKDSELAALRAILYDNIDLIDVNPKYTVPRMSILAALRDKKRSSEYWERKGEMMGDLRKIGDREELENEDIYRDMMGYDDSDW